MEKLSPSQISYRADDERIAALRRLFPEATVDGRIDLVSLGELLQEQTATEPERFGLVWPGKSAARRRAQLPSTATLRPRPDQSVEWNDARNLIIEGDNLEVLKLLQKSYHRQVDLVYIDPPYNTGNDFIYSDRFSDGIQDYLEFSGQVDESGRRVATNSETSGRYHSGWLTMMYPRLKLARNLLSERGAICVSIDEHEAFNLQHLLEEVFGGENFVGCIAVSMNPKGRQLAPFFATAHEYIFVYARDIDSCALRGTTSETVDASDFPNSDERGRFRYLPLRNTNKKFNPRTRPNLSYPLFIDTANGTVGVESSAGCVEVWPVFGSGEKAVWRWGKPKAERESIDLTGKLVKGRTGERWDIFQRDYLGTDREKKLTSIWTSKEIGSTDTAAKEVAARGVEAFDTPKPTALLKRLISLMPSDSVVMDFFAGSGTTGEACGQLNMNDGGSRRYMLIQLPEAIDGRTEATLADLTRKRLRNAAEERGTTALPAESAGFRAFSLATSNIRAWDANWDKIEESLFASVESVKPDRSEEDVLYEILLKYGLDLAIPIESRTVNDKKVYIIGAGALVVCLATGVTLEVVEGIAALKDELKPEVMRVVFRDAGFSDDVVKTNTVQILKQAGVDDVKSL